MLHLSWPAAKVAPSQEWEATGDEADKENANLDAPHCSPGSLPRQRGGCHGALLSFHQDPIDAETSLTHISIPANGQIQKKKGFAGTFPNQVELSARLQDTLQIAARQEQEQSGVPLHGWC